MGKAELLDGAIMKDLNYLQLWDRYSALLTEHQKEVFELYYTYDLSLSEIAEQKGCSKQSVSDTLAKCRLLLDEYEEKLHFNKQAQKSAKQQAQRAEAEEKLRALIKQYPALKDELEQICSLVSSERE
ncbi:MAG: DNA-binding protein [Clostridia bacterium]|nr:DNA-binding protein [Clostridia bacterium]